MAAVRSVNIDAAVYEISNISSLADSETTLTKLKNIETRSDWPLPAREAAIHQFTRSLAELPRAAVAVEIMQQVRTRVEADASRFEDADLANEAQLAIQLLALMEAEAPQGDLYGEFGK